MLITKHLLGILVLSFVFINSAHALRMPKQGDHMNTVRTQFGPPVNEYDAVGKPPITRWDYEEFSVFFEHSLTIHSVDHSKALIPTAIRENHPRSLGAPLNESPESQPAAPAEATSATPANTPAQQSNDKFQYDTATGRMVPRK